MDKMTDYEVMLCVENIPYCDVNIWETTRLKLYTSAQMFSKDKIKIKDIMSFCWDSKDDDIEEVCMSDDEVNRLKRLAEQLK